MPVHERRIQRRVRSCTTDEELGLSYALWRRATVRRWLRQDYPVIAARAKSEHAIIFRSGETGLRGDDMRGRCHAPRGRTPASS